MNSKNHYHGINEYAVKIIRFKARQLSRLPFFGSKDIEDLEQELVLDLFQRMSGFNPDLASQNTFAARIVENCAASMVSMATASSRNGGQSTISWEEMLESGHADDAMSSKAVSSLSESSNNSDVEVALDLKRCLQQLSGDQKRLCQLLPFHKPSTIYREMGWSRATFFRRVAHLRETFMSAGLEIFFAAA